MGRQFTAPTGSLAAGIDNTRFEVRQEHITLLRHACVAWLEFDFGAPGIDPKRPYGASGRYSIIADMGRILGIAPASTDEYGDQEYTEDQERYLERLHADLEVVVAIMFQNGGVTPGMYQRTKDVAPDVGRRVWNRIHHGAGFSVELQAQMDEQRAKLKEQDRRREERRRQHVCKRCGATFVGYCEPCKLSDD